MSFSRIVSHHNFQTIVRTRRTRLSILIFAYILFLLVLYLIACSSHPSFWWWSNNGYNNYDASVRFMVVTQQHEQADIIFLVGAKDNNDAPAGVHKIDTDFLDSGPEDVGFEDLSINYTKNEHEQQSGDESGDKITINPAPNAQAGVEMESKPEPQNAKSYEPTIPVENQVDNATFHQYLRIYNNVGQVEGAFGWEIFHKIMSEERGSQSDELGMYSKNKEAYAKIQEKIQNRKLRPNSTVQQTVRDPINRARIFLAVVACGLRKDEAMVMLKSAIMFSQDAFPHFVIFSDRNTILEVAARVLELRWTALGHGSDFTFELHLDWFPNDSAWKSMWAPCSTQRLFFPSLLPHIDSLIYLDSDTLILSNLTEFWSHLKNNMAGSKMAAMAPNSESTAPGYYESYSKTPFYGDRGLNAGIMLMNLTQMREFGLEEKCEKIYSTYKDNITLADQDILNTLFHDYPDKLHVLNCSYNFYWVHCLHPLYNCYDQQGNSICFCRSIYDDGVQIVHGNMGTFRGTYMPFLPQLYTEFEKVDMILTDHLEFISSLQSKFRLHQRPCGPLTAELMYNNAMTYLKNLYQ